MKIPLTDEQRNKLATAQFIEIDERLQNLVEVMVVSSPTVKLSIDYKPIPGLSTWIDVSVKQPPATLG